MFRICSWCGKDIGEKPPYEYKTTTNGICESCERKLTEEE